MKKKSAILGAAFLMATSAIGPGFLTQTAVFTNELLTSFGFVILVSILLDIGAQLNIWRIITISENRAQDLANKVLPGLGFFLAGMISFGALVFNVGNIAGAGLGLEILTGLDVKTGAAISCLLALAVFWLKEAGSVIDHFTKVLGLIMIVLTIYVAVSSHPPVAEALLHTIWPEKIDLMKIVTLVGGTVGGYISFAGAHRLMDAGIKGRSSIKQVTQSSVSGILITSFMRFVLFLAALGVVWNGGILDAGNPAASVFQISAGAIGYKFFGVVMWSAAITSVVGASYTSFTFWKTLHPVVEKNERMIISIFIILSTFIFITIARPVTLLILAGAINGLILPMALAIILVASRNKQLLHNYRHPVILQIIGWLVVAVMTWMGVLTIRQNFASFFN